MLHRLLSEMYEIPAYIYAVLAVAVIAAWGVLIDAFSEKRAFRVVNAVLAAGTALGILCIAVLLRSPQNSGLVWQPFAVFSLAARYSDVYNQMVLNVLLFMPLGLTLPTALPARVRHPLTVTLLSGVGLSLAVEALQWGLSRGYTEVDDVMLNALGTVIGLLGYAVAARLRNKREVQR